MANRNGTNRSLHDARQAKIREARAAAKTRLLGDKEAHAKLRRNARTCGRETLLSRNAVTEEQITQWAEESALVARRSHEEAAG